MTQNITKPHYCTIKWYATSEISENLPSLRESYG